MVLSRVLRATWVCVWWTVRRRHTSTSRSTSRCATGGGPRTDPQLTGAEVDVQLRDWDRFASRFAPPGCDVYVAIGPVVRDVAPLARPLGGDDYVFTLPWSLAGWAAVSLPAGTDPTTGLPLAADTAAPRWHDTTSRSRWLRISNACGPSGAEGSVVSRRFTRPR